MKIKIYDSFGKIYCYGVDVERGNKREKERKV